MLIHGELALDGCTGLTGLPWIMKVLGWINLSNDLQEQVKKDAEILDKKGEIRFGIKYE